MNIHERTRLLGSSAPGTRLRVHFARLFQEDNQVALLEDQIILSVPAPWTSWQTSHGSARLAKVLSAIEFVPNFQRRPVCQRGLTGLQPYRLVGKRNTWDLADLRVYIRATGHGTLENV